MQNVDGTDVGPSEQVEYLGTVLNYSGDVSGELPMALKEVIPTAKRTNSIVREDIEDIERKVLACSCMKTSTSYVS